MDEERIDRATRVFKALSDPNGLRFFAKLIAGGSCNSDIKDRLDLVPNLLFHQKMAL